MSIPSLSDLLKRMVDSGGSDLHITTNSPPRIRVHGELKPCEELLALGPVDTKQLCYSILTDAQKHRFEENLNSTSPLASKTSRAFEATCSTSEGRWPECFA
jgi:twitching motility protein PilT